MVISDKRKFEDASNGYGFDEIEQNVDGVYCTGCLVVHKRPTKMYSNGEKEILCRYQVTRLYWHEDLSS